MHRLTGFGLVFVCLAFEACGNEIASDDAGSDATADGHTSDVSHDDASDATTGDVNVGDADASTDGPSTIALHFKCVEGNQCEAGTPVCCATLQFHDCLLSEISSACAAVGDCPTTLQPFCAQTETVHLCDRNADCTEPAYDKCCTFEITGYAQSVVMCANQQMADAVDASCVPNDF